MKRGPEAPGFDLSRDVLFVGQGTTAVAYYRCFLPAMAMGADWVGIAGEPPKATWVTGLAQGQSAMPNLLTDYKIVVLQQAAGKGWNQSIEAMREAGVKVIYEIDDYLHGIQHMEDHDFRKHYGKDHLADVEAAMKRCDALIASTEWIRASYRPFIKKTYVCQNGIDVRRYDLTRPDRPTVNIGWAGATGHAKALLPWLQQTAGVMRMRPNTTFVSIGQGFAEAFAQHFPNRAVAVPFAAIEQYPSAMTMMDIGLAPAGRGGWYRGKSDLRWLEAGALGIPLIASPVIYKQIEHGETGFLAANPMEMAEHLVALVDDEKLRTEVGRKARDVVRRTRSIEAVAPEWKAVFDEVLDS